MGWIKDGSTIKANYLGDFEVVGIVTESRVKYGGKVQYTVKLDEPVYLYSDSPRDILLIDEDDLIADFGVINGD
jgi:hypothetical protein